MTAAAGSTPGHEADQAVATLAAAPAEVPGPDMSAQQLLRRSRRLIWLTLLPLLGLVLLVAAWQGFAQWRRVVDAAAADARTQSFAFAAIAREATHHVADLRHWMGKEFARTNAAAAAAAEPGIANALQARPSATGRADGWSLDALTPLLRDRMAQVIWPQGDGTPPAASALRRAQAISDVIDLAHQRNADFAWSYFYGWPDRHLVLFPWVPSRSLAEDEGDADLSAALARRYQRELITAGLQDGNPTRQPYWTAPYDEPGGQRRLVSHAAPLYVADELRGIVGTDINLATLQHLLERLPGAPWHAWLVDDQGRVLAQREPDVSIQGRRVITVVIDGAPWSLRLAARDRDLVWATLPQVLPYSLIVLALLGVWLFGQEVLRQRIISPVLALLGYLQRLSADAGTPEPQLGQRWQPWVQMVTRTFSSMRQSAQREQHAEALKSAIVDHAQAAVVVSDEAGRVVEFNPAAEAMLGCTREQALGQQVGELLIPARFRARFDVAMARMRAGDPDGLMGRRLKRVSRHADGSEFPVEVVVWMTQVDATGYFTASMTDLTAVHATAEVIERQREALRQSEKLTAMGSLLAGVAHELNNPLAIVMGRASLLEEKTVGTPLQSDAVRIREAAERCGRIVRTFLNMARSRPAQRGPVRLNDLARAAAEMLAYTLRSHGIELELRLAPDLPELQADGDQIGQVVLNLIVNAQQSLATHDGPRRIRVQTGLAADGVAEWLAVSDSGPGVAAAVRDKIFEPFFTTKAEGIGTGLGLSVSRSIVREHGGELLLDESPTDTEADAQAPQGARFVLRMALQVAAPLPQAEAATAGSATTAAAAHLPTAARVLVVDDEPEITDLLRTMLEEAGCEVATANEGAVALALLDAGRFDAIVSDMRMPDIDGAALWRAVRERHGALAGRMVFVTGDTLSLGARRFLDETGCAHLDKPFTRDALLAQLAVALHTADPDV